LIVGLLLLNLLIAILTTAYEDAREDSGAAFWAKNQYRAIVRESGNPACFNREGCCDPGLTNENERLRFTNRKGFYIQSLYILLFRPGDYALPWIGLVTSRCLEIAENFWLFIRRPFVRIPRSKKPERIDVHDGNIFRSQTRGFTRSFSKIQRRTGPFSNSRPRWRCCSCCPRRSEKADILLLGTGGQYFSSDHVE